MSTKQEQCGFLNLQLYGKVSFPREIQYLYQESRYWSQQQETTDPTCRVAPTQTPDVSLTLYVLKSVGCQFAVKSGGHGAFVGASNINGGVTIDLLNMNTITVSADQTQASYGAGNRWIDVYTELESMGLAVIGGRVADIGVGGLTLGGGISFFSGRFGWACDNVNNYEVCRLPTPPQLLVVTLTRDRSYLQTELSTKSTCNHIRTSTLLFAVGGTISEL
jgi:FAD/FMN-containing dehydrogenase